MKVDDWSRVCKTNSDHDLGGLNDILLIAEETGGTFSQRQRFPCHAENPHRLAQQCRKDIGLIQTPQQTRRQGYQTDI